MNGFLLVIIFAVLIIVGVPIAYSIGITAMVGIFSLPGIPAITVPMKMFNGLNNFVLLAVPLFILCANIMNSGMISKKMIEFATASVGSVPGGLAHANVLVSMLFAGVSGSSTADAAGIGRILIPSMIDTGYDKETSVGVTAASSVIGIIIPPSIPMVVYAGMANCDVAAMFMGGLVPGILIGLGMMLVIFIYSFSKNYPVYGKSTFQHFMKCLGDTLPALFTPVIILGGVITGLYTATESAAFAALYALVVSMFYYKTITLKDLPVIVRDSMLQSAQALFTLSAASALGELLGYYKISVIVDKFFSGNVSNKYAFLGIVIVFFLIIGTFMDNLPAIILFIPVLLPTALRLGVDAITLGIISVITLAIGLVTPPYGICLLISADIGKLPIGRSFAAVIPYILVILIVLGLIVAFPPLVTTVPQLISGLMNG